MDLKIYRGETFTLPLVAQIKNYAYDPDVHNAPEDLARTHEENLKHYRFTYEYIDFETTYSAAILEITKGWLKGSEPSTPLLTLSLDSGITFDSRTLTIELTAAETSDLEWESGDYTLLLTTPGGIVNQLLFGKVDVNGEKP